MFTVSKQLGRSNRRHTKKEGELTMTKTVTNKWYSVKVRFYNNGKTTAEIREHDLSYSPENLYADETVCHTYVDWFRTLKEAQDCASDVYNA